MKRRRLGAQFRPEELQEKGEDPIKPAQEIRESEEEIEDSARHIEEPAERIGESGKSIGRRNGATAGRDKHPIHAVENIPGPERGTDHDTGTEVQPGEEVRNDTRLKI